MGQIWNRRSFVPSHVFGVVRSTVACSYARQSVDFRRLATAAATNHHRRQPQYTSALSAQRKQLKDLRARRLTLENAQCAP
jgi:hypothetical protein